MRGGYEEWEDTAACSCSHLDIAYKLCPKRCSGIVKYYYCCSYAEERVDCYVIIYQPCKQIYRLIN